MKLTRIPPVTASEVGTAQHGNLQSQAGELYSKEAFSVVSRAQLVVETADQRG